jgi:DNA-binding NarL/FixJ family response regulator
MAQPVRVLIADDNARSRDGLRALLGTARLSSSTAPRAGTRNKKGYEIEVVGEAANGREAVRQAEKCRPDVILMDARMPEMDGLEATRLIKSRWPKVRIVVLTLYAGYRARALAAGANAFLVKGCPNEKLMAAILNSGESQSNPER